jgi:FSR family fosmidomycin resistance protein-like MFS transporter
MMTASFDRGLLDPRHVVPTVYGLVHAVIDATTVAVVLCASGIHGLAPHEAFALIVGYDVIAFGAQSVFGLLTDALKAPRATAIAGVAIAILSLVALPYHAVVATACAGVGNALFHVGAGALSLSVDAGRATAPGVFVGPGALGLAIGMFIGKHGAFSRGPFFALLALALVLLPLVRVTPRASDASSSARGFSRTDGALIVALLLFSILVRSFVGMGGFQAVHKTPTIGFAIATAAFAGKALGGVVADRWGWMRTTVGALLISAPLIAFCTAHAMVMVGAMFLFQMTMPVTLAALTVVYPKRPAFAFGLACLALLAGVLPAFSQAVHAYYGNLRFLALILASAATLHVALRRLERRTSTGAAGVLCLQSAGELLDVGRPTTRESVGAR